jgi:hypothetical protein
MIRLKYLLLVCFALTGCATLLTEQEYRLIDEKVSEKIINTGSIFYMPKKAQVRKIVLIGEGRIKNFDVAVRDDKNRWKPVTRITQAIEFPFEILLFDETDAVKISQRTIVGKGHINTVQFYTIADKYE